MWYGSRSGEGYSELQPYVDIHSSFSVSFNINNIENIVTIVTSYALVLSTKN